jgi:hypothetical protein
LITSLCFSDDYILLGLLNGVIKVFDNSGELMGDHGDYGSRIPIILGCALSPDGDDLVALSGIDSQELVLLRTREIGKAEPITVQLTSDFRREVFIKFSDSGQLVYFESNHGLGIFDVASKKIVVIPFQGSLIGLTENQRFGIMSFLYKSDWGVELKVCTSNGRTLYSKYFDCEYAHLRQIDDYLLIGCDETLLRVDLRKE